MFVCCKSKTDSLKAKFYKTSQIMRLEANLFYSRQVLLRLSLLQIQVDFVCPSHE